LSRGSHESTPLVAISQHFEGRGANYEVVIGGAYSDQSRDIAVWEVAAEVLAWKVPFIACVAELELGGPRVGRSRAAGFGFEW